jgi:glutamate-1-semialdehyde 2,1-aminomutase
MIADGPIIGPLRTCGKFRGEPNVSDAAAKLNDKWTKSHELLRRAQGSLAGGVSSPFRAKFTLPLYFADGHDCRLVDVDGNQYIDYALGWGPNILGYRHPKIVAAVAQAASGPHTYGEQHELEIFVAEKIQALVPCAERVAFTSSGSEAVQFMMRLARAFTHRPLILKFEGHYHGWMDTALWSYHPKREDLGPRNLPEPVSDCPGQIAETARSIVVRPWNDIALVADAFEQNAGRIAGVMMEPVLCNSGCILPQDGYLAKVRELCARRGALLMFDEVITGFRIDPGGAQSYYGVTPDLATLGKAVGGGLPLSVIAGRREIMELPFTEGVAFGGTFNGNPLSLAGAHATLEEISIDNGTALKRANEMGLTLMEGIRRIAKERGEALLVTGFGAAFAVHFTPRAELWEYRDLLEDDAEALRNFLRRLLSEGIHCLPDGRFYVSAVHGPREIESTLAAVARAL